jgi:predicted phosphodiesterase
MAQRTLIISDTHFGDPVKTAGPIERFKSLINSTDHLIINGDGFEFEPPKARILADESLASLSAMCQEKTVQLTAISGNHDPHDAWPRHLFLAQEKILLTHGESFHPSISPWCSVAKPLQEAYAQAIASLAAQGHPDDMSTRLQAAHIANKAEWRRELKTTGHTAHRTTILSLAMSPHKVFRLFNYWRIIPGYASQFAQQYAPQSKVVIFGHTHHEGVWRRQGRLIINTGAYRFPGRPLACTFIGQTLKVHRLQLRHHQYHLAPRPLLEINIDSLP